MGARSTTPAPKRSPSCLASARRGPSAGAASSLPNTSLNPAGKRANPFAGSFSSTAKSQWALRTSIGSGATLRATHSCRVWGTHPILGAIDSMAAHREGYSPRCSCTMRTARSRTSGENLVDFLMAPSSQRLEPPQNPGRFSRIRRADYDSTSRQLDLHWANKTILAYKPVPEGVYRPLCSGPNPATCWEDRIAEECPKGTPKTRSAGSDAARKLSDLFGDGE